MALAMEDMADMAVMARDTVNIRVCSIKSHANCNNLTPSGRLLLSVPILARLWRLLRRLLLDIPRNFRHKYSAWN